VSGQLEPCVNCGAPTRRAAECEYCSPAGKALDPALLASVMKGALDDIEQAFHHLAEKLEASFPDHTQVETSGGLLSAKKVKLLEVTVDPHLYRMRRDGKHVVSERVKVVRGVALKTTALRFDEWLKELAHDLTKLAADTAESRAALSRWVRGE
jgi:hypothetical protein